MRAAALFAAVPGGSRRASKGSAFGAAKWRNRRRERGYTGKMQPEVLDEIPFEIHLPALRDQMHLAEGSEDAEAIGRLVEQARAVGRPKALFRLAYVEGRGEDSVVIEALAFTSRVLRVNLDGVHRVFAYLGTCGRELHDWAESLDDMLERYWADAIKALALSAAMQALNRHADAALGPGKTSGMNPGSLPDWPISQQRPLFDLLGDPRQAVSVELTDSFLMIPNKSISGIRFPTEATFESCQLCPREVCPGRRAPYDPNLYARRFAPKDNP